MMSTAVFETVSADLAPIGQPCREGCRFCGNSELHLVVDLGMSPLCENFLSRDQLLEMESFYPSFSYGWAPLRALCTGPYKYIEAPRPELYELPTDPRETRDVLSQKPKRASEIALALTVRTRGDTWLSESW